MSGNNTMLTNNTTNYSASQACDSAASSIAVAGWCVFGIGITSNTLLFYFILRKLASGKRNDKLFLLNITIANFLALFGSLLGVVLSRGSIVSSAQNYCLLFHEIKFISLFANLTSMAGLCYDRYENVTLFPGQRKLSFKKSIKLVAVGAWVLPLILVPIAQVGFFVTVHQGKSICKVESNRTAYTSDIISFFALIVLVTLWITASEMVIRYSFRMIYSKLKQHRLETEKVLGIAKTVKEVNLKKQAELMIICYSICWIPFGIVAGLTAANIVNFHSCFYFGCQIVADASTATTPLVYLTMDKRFRFKFRKEKHRGNKSTTVT